MLARSVLNFLTRFTNDRRGSVGIMFGLSVVPLMAFIGLAVDMSRAFLVQSRLAHAIDAGALAVASTNNPSVNLTNRLNAFLAANFPDTSLGTPYNVDLTINGNLINVSAAVDVPTMFMAVLGAPTMTVTAHNQVEQQITGLEVSMVLDNTGSLLTNNNIGALRTAATSFINIMFNSGATNSQLKIGIVPYTASVNPGSIAPSLVTNTTGYPYNPSVAADWKGCVTESKPPSNNYPYTYTDSVFNSLTWGVYRWGNALDNNWTPTHIDANPADANNEYGPNLGCGQPIQPLISDQATLLNDISSMQAWSRGGTLGNIGTAWGLRIISPGPLFTQAVPFGTTGWHKVMIIMTDGFNEFYCQPYAANNNNCYYNSDYTAYGRIDANLLGTTNATTGANYINNDFLNLCDYIRGKGISIYTVLFSAVLTPAETAAVQARFLQCTGNNPQNYFYAPTQASLQTAFQSLANTLSNLRLTQ